MLVFAEQGTELSFDIHVLSLDGERASRALLSEPFAEFGGVISPDGRWLAYHSDEADVLQVYVRPFPDVGGGKWQITTGGGRDPVWSADGRELFYRNGPAVLAVPVATTPTFSPGVPEVVFDEPDYETSETIVGVRHYDVSPDGQRFLMITRADPTDQTTAERIQVVLNWFEELPARVPTGR